MLAAVLMPLIAGAQAQINTKKVQIEDFTQKVTKIVLNGNPFYDASIKDEVSARWRISPYEFCTLEEFETVKNSDQYYFLMITQGQFRKELAPGIQFLTLVKGGKGSDKGIDEMLEVVSIPFASAEYPSGRELIFLPAFLDIIQAHTLEAMENDRNAYGGLSISSEALAKSADMNIVFSEDDLSRSVTDEIIRKKFDSGMTITDEDEADQHMTDNTSGTLVSYVVAPTDPVHGSYCYKMLIDSDTYKLHYFRRHRVSRSFSVGFMPEDIDRITAHRSKRR